MAPARLRTAVIGTGKVAQLHAAALRELPQSEFVAACGRPSDRLAAFGAAHRVPVFTEVAEMIRAARVEAVCICTPHPEHAEPALAALRAGVHALVEKPLASTLGDCDRMIAAARSTGAVLGTVSQRRFYPPCARIRQALDAGALGRPVLATAVVLGWRDRAYYASDPWRGTWAKEGGGVLVNQSPHQLDLLLWYMGAAAEVYGNWANLNHPDIEVEDTAVAVVRFRSGGLGSLVVSNSQNPGVHARVTVHGENGASVGVQTDGGSMFVAGMTGIIAPPYNDIWTIPAEPGQLAAWKDDDARRFAAEDPMRHFHRVQIADFLDAIRAGRPPRVTAEDGRRTVELFTAIYRSNADRRPVALPLAP